VLSIAPLLGRCQTPNALVASLDERDRGTLVLVVTHEHPPESTTLASATHRL
jgi:hypothetical protein